MAGERISEIVGAVKCYTYLDQAPVQRIDVRKGLDDTLVILRSKLRAGVDVTRHYAPNLPEIEAYGSELNQVWTNLVDNATDAMDGRGAIDIYADPERRGRRPGPHLRHRPGHPGRRRCHGSSSPSSPPRRRAWGPGLACTSPTRSSRATAAGSKWSRPGEGTCFIVTLPAKVAAPSERGRGRDGPAATAGHDEPPVADGAVEGRR